MSIVMEPHDVAAYLERVRTALADLPAEALDELLADVEASLHDAAAEGEAPAARLGPPEDFARELRSAAGLGVPGSRGACCAAKSRRSRLPGQVRCKRRSS